MSDVLHTLLGWVIFWGVISIGFDLASQSWRSEHARKNPRHLVGAWGWILR